LASLSGIKALHTAAPVPVIAMAVDEPLHRVFDLMSTNFQTNDKLLEHLHVELVLVRDEYYKQVVAGKVERSPRIEFFFAFVNRKDLRSYYDDKSKKWFTSKPEGWFASYCDMKERCQSPLTKAFCNRMEYGND
jgi:hypothetical protein